MKQSQILHNISSRMGIDSLNDMQKRVVDTPSRDMILLSPTGSGKTLAFTIKLLSALREPHDTVQAVVIAPSRELVMQIYDVIRPLAIGFKVACFYGGHSMMDEKRTLSVIPDIIVATPGRLLDHVNRKQIDLYTTRILVLDEYDKSLELGFHDEMKRVVRTMPSLSHRILTSATRLSEFPEWLRLDKPATIDCLGGATETRHRLQVVEVESPARDKIDMLIELMRSLDNGRVIIFVNHRESVERVYNHLRKAGLPAGLYHGGLEQIDREKAIDLLNNGTTPILVSTDLGSRGLDIEAVRAVVHYHLPVSEEAWIHRNGRTARVDATGTVYVITSEADSIPDFVRFDRSYTPTGHNDNPIRSDVATLYFNSGKREKVSRGDILGYLVNQAGIEASQIGKIVVKDHSALAAIPRQHAGTILTTLKGIKLKGKSVRISLLK